jgi:hypothetical protein
VKHSHVELFCSMGLFECQDEWKETLTALNISDWHFQIPLICASLIVTHVSCDLLSRPIGDRLMQINIYQNVFIMAGLITVVLFSQNVDYGFSACSTFVLKTNFLSLSVNPVTSLMTNVMVQVAALVDPADAPADDNAGPFM